MRVFRKIAPLFLGALLFPLAFRALAVDCVCTCSNGCTGHLHTEPCTEPEAIQFQNKTKVVISINCGHGTTSSTVCVKNGSTEKIRFCSQGCCAEAFPQNGQTWGTVSSCSDVGGGCS